MLRGRRVGLAGRCGVRDAGAVSERPDVVVALDPQHFVDADAVALVERQPEVGEQRVRADARRPDERRGRDARAVGQYGGLGVDRLEGDADVDLDPALRQLACSVLTEAARDLGQDLRRGVDEHPAPRLFAQLGVVAARVRDEVGQLRQRLDARVAGADEDEGQLSRRGPRAHRGGIESAQDMIAQVDRVGEVLKAEAVVGEARDRKRPRDRAEREHEPLVLDLEGTYGRCVRARVERC